jgi:hypothetical protein
MGTGRKSVVVLSLLAVAGLAGIAIVLLTRGGGGGGGGGAGAKRVAPVVAPFDGTAYVETNSSAPGSNAVLAFRYRAGSLQPLRIAAYPAGGSGSKDLDNAGVLDADQQVVVNADRTLLFAINQGSDTVAAFHVAPDGSLRPVEGSPFPSGGRAPGSLGVSGDVLIVANKAHDGVHRLRTVEANYTTFRIQPGGALRPTGSTVTVPPRSSPTQVYVAPGGRLVFSTEESGRFRAFQLGRGGTLTQAPGSPVSLPSSIFPHGRRSSSVWPAGLSADPRGRGILYSGVPNLHKVVAYSYTREGRLSFVSAARDRKAILPCWSVVSGDGHTLYFANAGSDNLSVWDLGADPRAPRLAQTVKLRGGGNPWNLQLTPDGRFLFAITPRQVREIPRGLGNTIHVLRVGAGGTLSEPASSPVPLPVPVDTNPLGLALVPHG